MILALAALFAGPSLVTDADGASRIKDIASFEGVRDNLLVGYGLVVGLNNTGDTLDDGHFTKQSLLSMLERLGVKPTEDGLTSQNVAAVMVTAVLSAFARQGSRIDVTVSALGDSDSLLGGTLLVTPLLGADGEVYAVSQGQIAVGGFTAGGDAETIVKGVPTSGRIANGGIVERETGFELGGMKNVKISLRNPDFTTARRMAQVSQPGPFAEAGTTTTVARTDIEVDEGADNRLTVVERGVTLQDLVNGLNALGIGPRDLITILQAVKTAGALQAEIVVMWWRIRWHSPKAPSPIRRRRSRRRSARSTASNRRRRWGSNSNPSS